MVTTGSQNSAPRAGFITIRAMRGSGRSTTMVSYAVMVLTLLSVTVQRFSRLPVGQENL
jgi:hypothetical protein